MSSNAKKRKRNDAFQDENIINFNDVDVNEDIGGNEKPTIKTYNLWRSRIRGESVFSDSVGVSLQTCKTANNRKVLLAWKNASKDKVLKNRIDGLLAVLETLQLPSTHQLQADIEETDKGFPGIKHGGFLGFQEAFELYIDHTISISINQDRHREDTLKSQFILDLFNDHYGIRCLVLTIGEKRVIFLDNDEVNMPSMINHIAEEFQESKKKESKAIDCKFIRDSLETMDTEYDRNICRSIIAMVLSRDDLEICGINPTRAKTNLNNMREVLDAVESAGKPANDMVKARISKRIKRLKSKLRSCRKKTMQTLSSQRSQEVTKSLQLIEKQIEEENAVLLQHSKYHRQRFQQRVNRLAKKIVREKRLKQRKSGAGAKPKLDSEDEEFIAKAIETMGSAHGRRHDSVLYLNHRVKSTDLLTIANHNLEKRGKRLIKSSRTVMLRSKPKKINTREAKRHKGKWLYCIRKPPKTEESRSELTHHQRAHVTLNRWDMFGDDSKIAKHSVELSFDDKAYVRPGTEVGFRNTKSRGIIQLSDTNAAKKLPQHDFGNPDVFVTPSALRIMSWQTETIEGKNTLIKENDQSFVTMRPKKYVGSSGSVWASNILSWNHKYPQHFQLSDEDCHVFSIPLRSICTKLKDIASYFIDTTTDEDIIAMSEEKKGSVGEFRKYEIERLHWLFEILKKVQSDEDVKEDEKDLLERLTILIQYASVPADVMESLLHESEDIEEDSALKEYANICEKLQSIIDFIEKNEFPSNFRFVSEYTDAGPGVGVSNIEAKIRFTEMCRLHNSDRRIRLHRAPGDSAQNEAERTNACIGDAMVDGGTLEWQNYKPLEDLNKEEIEKMSIDEIIENENQCTEKNAWYAAEELCYRIDDQPGPGGDFMISDVAEKLDEQFFQNKEYLLKLWESKDSEEKRRCLPGHGYFKKLYSFYEVHCDVGELYIEFRKDKCDKDGEKCDFCLKHPALEGILKPVPRPYPDYNLLPEFKYRVYEATPLHNEDDTFREIDDFNPRFQLKMLFDKGELNSTNAEAVKQFSERYIVEEELVYQRLQHLEYLKLKRIKRAEQTQKKRQEEMKKAYQDYDWLSLYRLDKLRKLTGQVFDKYIKHHNLQKPRLVDEKCSVVTAHIKNSISEETPCGGNSGDSVEDQGTSESDSASNHSYSEADECIIASCGSTESSSVPESSSDEGDQTATSERPARGLFSLGEVQTRRGRTVRPPAYFSDFL